MVMMPDNERNATFIHENLQYFRSKREWRKVLENNNMSQILACFCKDYHNQKGGLIFPTMVAPKKLIMVKWENH